MDDLTATRDFTDWFDEKAAAVDDAAASGASRLPRWTRGHVLTHLARNADGLVNLLTWARTGVEHPMYASDADRDADIAEGGNRISRLLQEDLRASNQRFFAAAEALPSTAWETSVTARAGAELPVSRIPFVRLSELAIHLVDLDCGVGFSDVVDKLGERTERLVKHAVAPYRKREGIPAVRLAVTLPDERVTTWEFGTGDPVAVAGAAADAVGWLTGRADGAALDGPAPALPTWK
jgi:maleylpyruvate isomerase